MSCADELSYIPACTVSYIHIYDGGCPAGLLKDCFCFQSLILRHPQEIYAYLLCHGRSVDLIGKYRKCEISQCKDHSAHNTAVSI